MSSVLPMSSSAERAAATSSRVPALDALRILAAGLVALHHWNWVAPAAITGIPGYSIDLARFGFLGVELFFAISGFVILMSAQGATWQQFVRARALRLYPTFWICCTLTAIVTGSIGTTAYALNLTMLPTQVGVGPIDGVYWTLAYEIAFYFVVAVVVGLGWLHRFERVLWGWLLIIAFWQPYPVQRLIMADYGPYFIGGCACYLLSQRWTISRTALLIAAVGLAVPHAVGRAVRMATSNGWGVDEVAVGASVVIGFGLVLAAGQRWFRVPGWRWLATAAAMTYPFYLLHGAIGYAIADWARSTPITPAAAYVLVAAWTIGMAWLVTVRIEPPFKRLVRRAGLAMIKSPKASSSGHL